MCLLQKPFGKFIISKTSKAPETKSQDHKSVLKKRSVYYIYLIITIRCGGMVLKARLFWSLCGTLCDCDSVKWLWHFQWSCIVSLEAWWDGREVWGLWLMLKAFAPVTWREEIRARCQQISTSTWLIQRGLALCVIPADVHKGFRFPPVILRQTPDNRVIILRDSPLEPK